VNGWLKSRGMGIGIEATDFREGHVRWVMGTRTRTQSPPVTRSPRVWSATKCTVRLRRSASKKDDTSGRRGMEAARWKVVVISGPRKGHSIEKGEVDARISEAERANAGGSRRDNEAKDGGAGYHAEEVEDTS
jgi:hypothetical protein